ncbi:YbeD family protein [Deefgea rivuli]|uniref:YbeD family protein n=1 Tax=Deefgea rivuli TaxID=400948 RepID=UPI000569B597|nr:DUF493 domain-containing protein [Deefgea rivuli]
MAGFTDIPSQKLEDLVTFPVLIPVKAVSHKSITHTEFAAEVLALTQVHIVDFTEALIEHRASSSGNYHALTLMITFANIEQVHALDAALRAHPMVRMVL